MGRQAGIEFVQQKRPKVAADFEAFYQIMRLWRREEDAERPRQLRRH
jgi:hypothetical protein